MEKKLYLGAAIWTVLGLLGGVFYREFTKFNNWDHPKFSQLSTVHTHALVLGAVFLLLVLVLERVFRLSASAKLMNAFVVVWHVGLAITVGMQLVKGVMQVLAIPAADSAAIAGISGLGHITLAVGFFLLFRALGKALKA